MAAPKRSPFAMPVVIGLLLIEPRHGYALCAAIERDLRGVWAIGMNRLYSLLDEMEQAGLISGKAERAGLRPQRRVYRSTAKGKRLFEQWMREPSARMSELRAEFPPKLYFVLRQERGALLALLRSQRDACRRELDRISARPAAAGDAAGDVEGLYRGLVTGFRVRQIQAILAWLDDCERELPHAPRGSATQIAHMPEAA